MPRYIDVNKIKLVGDSFKNVDGDTLVSLSDVRRAIEQTPTADVVEVRHGEWIYHECVSSHEGAISGYSCSECSIFVDEEVFEAKSFHKDFCGHCGVKMDGESKK